MFKLIFGIILAGIGIFIVYDVKKNGVNDPETGKAKMIVSIIGEKGAKIFYSILGYIVIFCGIGTIAGFIVSNFS